MLELATLFRIADLYLKHLVTAGVLGQRNNIVTVFHAGRDRGAVDATGDKLRTLGQLEARVFLVGFLH